MSPTKLGATVVLYNPSDEDIDNVSVLMKMADDVVVDNSPNPDPQPHARFAAQDIPVVDNRNVGGLARGLNVGTRAVRAGLRRGLRIRPGFQACSARKMPIVLLWNLSTALQLATVVFFEAQKRRKLVASFAGILDGLRGKWGTYAERWPRLQGH